MSLCLPQAPAPPLAPESPRRRALFQRVSFPEAVPSAPLRPVARRPAPYTLAEALEACIEEVRSVGSPSLRVYSVHAKRLAEDFPGLALRDLTPQDVQRWTVRAAAGDGRRPLRSNSIRHVLAFLSRVCRQAVRDGHLAENPLAKVKKPRPGSARDRVLFPEEEERLRQAMRPHDFEIVTLYLNTGFRRGELFGLRWRDVEFSAGFLRVAKSKTGHPRRIPINGEVRAILSRWADLRPERDPADFVLCPKAKSREAVAHSWAQQAFRSTCAAVGICGIHLHDLRHTFASRLLARGVNIRVVQELLGHSTVAMTERYCHVTPEHLRQAVGVLAPLAASESAAELERLRAELNLLREELGRLKGGDPS